MTKRYIVFILLLVFVFFSTKRIFSQEQFLTSASVEYKVGVSGVTTVTHNINLENATSEFYAQSYTLTLSSIDPVNPVAYQNGKPLIVKVQKRNTDAILEVQFDDQVVGKGAKRSFSISFDEKNFVTKTGEVWEISIPRLLNKDTFASYNIDLLIPDAFGHEAYITPEPIYKTKIGGFTRYNFNKTTDETGIYAGFGEFQVFSFNLKYHLENATTNPGLTQIALPPDTQYQKVYFEKISPAPKDIKIDEDGNWLAQYYLNNKQKIDIEAVGSVQIFSKPRGLPNYGNDISTKYLASTQYWQSDDSKIIELAKRFKTPKDIYNYVSTSLTYDYQRVSPNVERLGAIRALEHPTNAICMEFTDLFIAIARAAGIPAREINGYAFTQNPEIEPLGLVADVLHSWPEYWDPKKDAWVPIDPTWANTTGGVDFFSQLDLRHFAFVIHGVDSVYPYPPGSYKSESNPQKDVFVKFGNLPKIRTASITIETAEKNIPFFTPDLMVTVKNIGPVAVYDTPLEIYFDNKSFQNERLPYILPFGNYQKEIKVPYTLLSIGAPEKIQLFVGSATSVVPTRRLQAIIYNLILLLGICLAVVITAFLALRKLNPFKHVVRSKKNTIK